MQAQYRYLPVNWIDGMKINKSHFIAQNNAFTYGMAQGTSSLLNEYNYGLLPSIPKGGEDLKLILVADNQQQVKIRLLKCKAITMGGYVIQFDEAGSAHNNHLKTLIPDLSLPYSELKEKVSEYFIILTIQPYERIAFGSADPNETPPRLPYTMPAFQLGLMPVSDATFNTIGHFQLPIGKLKIENGAVFLDDEYTPPCSTVCSHYNLLKLHATLNQFLAKIELHALHIIQKIMQRKQENEIATMVLKLCEHITSFTSTNSDLFPVINVYQPPVFLLHTASSLARLLKNTLDYYIGSGKDELINYFTEWCDIKQAELENCIVTLSNHVYNHLDFNASIEKVSAFVTLITQLFDNLSKLEYIGKRKDAGIFIKERLVKPEPEILPRNRSSFLAE